MEGVRHDPTKVWALQLGLWEGKSSDGTRSAWVAGLTGRCVWLLHLPSGVVEVLEVPEKAGLFPSVAGRIFFQHIGHGLPSGLGRTCRAWTKVWRLTTARSSRRRLWTQRGPEKTRTPLRYRPACLSAPDVRERFTSSTASVHRYHRRRQQRRLSTTRWIRDGRAHPARRYSAAAAAAPQSSRRRASRIVSPGGRTSQAATERRANENGARINRTFFNAC